MRSTVNYTSSKSQNISVTATLVVLSPRYIPDPQDFNPIGLICQAQSPSELSSKAYTHALQEQDHNVHIQSENVGPLVK